MAQRNLWSRFETRRYLWMSKRSVLKRICVCLL